MIDFSSKHNVLIRNEDGTFSHMDEPYFKSEVIAPDTWCITSDGDYSYLIAGKEKALAIDSGCGAGNIRDYMQFLTDVPVREIANTHHHFDHTANNSYFELVYMAEEGVGKATIPFPSFQGIDFPSDYPVKVIGDGDVIDLGERTLEVIAMPDHAESSLLFLDRKARILFVGDELGNHGKMLNGTVANFKNQLERLENFRCDFDYLCGGSDSMVEANYIERYLENCNHILEGFAGKELGGGPEGPPCEPPRWNIPEGTIVYERKKPRPCDRDGGNASDETGKCVMEWAGCRIIYDIDKVM